MRMVIDARYLDGSYSGIATYSRNLLENLSLIDQDNEYFVLVRPGFQQPIRLSENFQLLSFPSKPVSMTTLTFLGRSIEALKPNLVHSLFPLAPLMMRTPLMITVHDLQPFIDPEFSARRFRLTQAAYNIFYRFAYPAAMNRAKWIVCDSYTTRDQVEAFFPQFTAKLIPLRPGLDSSMFEDPPPDEVEAIRIRMGLRKDYFLYYGSTRPNKNLPNAVRAFAQARREGELSDLELVLVVRRDRFFRDVQKTIDAESLNDSVRIFDPLSISEQRAALAGATGLLFPSRHEGFGFPPLEAMAMGIPVIAGDSGSLPEICGDAARMVDPDNVSDIAEAIVTLAKDSSEREQLIARGEEQAARFDWQYTAEFLRDVYGLLF